MLETIDDRTIRNRFAFDPRTSDTPRRQSLGGSALGGVQVDDIVPDIAGGSWVPMSRLVMSQDIVLKLTGF